MRYFDFLIKELKDATENVKKRRKTPEGYKYDPKSLHRYEKEMQKYDSLRYFDLYNEFLSFKPHELKLMLMDAQQALIFSEKENPEDHWQEVIKPPFPTFFLEFTEPISLNEPEPVILEEEEVFGTNHDVVHAISYRQLSQDEIKTLMNKDGVLHSSGFGIPYSSTVEDGEYAFVTLLCQTDGRGSRDSWSTETMEDYEANDHSGVSYRDLGMDQYKIHSPALGGTMRGMFANEMGKAGREKFKHDTRAYNLLNPGIDATKTKDWEVDGSAPMQRIDRTFVYHLKTGKVTTSVPSVRDYFNDPSQLPEDYPFETITAGDSLGIENRYIGWWERAVLTYASLTNWTLLYLMAKGIEIVEEPLPRSEKRRRQREKNKQEEPSYPKDWHVIQSKPRFSNGSSSDSSNGNGTGNPHRFRYDVMGHLRHGRHLLRDGTWKLTLEWVPAHQRGLDNTLYIPATRKAETGKKSDERNYEYFRKPGELP